MEILDGKALSLELKKEIGQKVMDNKKAWGRKPHLAAILVGGDGASETYVNHKVKSCDQCGFESSVYRFESDITEDELLFTIKSLNDDDEIDGILVQLPLPKHIDNNKIIEGIDPSKDVDGFHPVSVGMMTKGFETYLPATPYGIMKMLERYKIETEGKHVVVLGRSDIVGRPMSIMLSQASNPGNATVTVCHSRTKNLKEMCQMADILIVAIGKPNFVTGDMVSEGAVVVDVGIHRVEDSSKKSGFRLTGDVDFESVSPKASWITPVPGGVGPMTICGLLMNTFESAKKRLEANPVVS